MTNQHAVHHATASTLSRRRLLSNLVAASSVALVAPILDKPVTSFAQTPVAMGTTMPNTIGDHASPRFRAIAETMMAELTATGTPGGALGILFDGREEYATFGVDSIDSGRPVTLETLFQIGSVTKTVTGTAIMRLVADGLLDLDETVRSYLPDLRLESEDVAATVTVRHLMTHTGGWWGDFFAETGSADDAIARYVERWLPTLPQLTPLGKLFNYNNSGFTLLGRLIEGVTSQTYREVIRESVLEPLGLQASFFARDDVTARPHANGHFTESGSTLIQEPLYLPRSVEPAGGLWSTAPDLIRYAAFHLGDGSADGSQVLPREMLDLMQMPQLPIPNEQSSSIGMPWFVVDVPGLHLLSHDGSTFGQGAALLMAPERGFAIAVLVNAQPGGGIATQKPLSEAFVNYLEWGSGDAQSATPGASLPSPTPSPVDLNVYAGRYEVPVATYDLQVVDDALVVSYELHPLPEQVLPTLEADIPARIPLQFIAEDLAVVEIAGVPQLLGFVRDDDGDIGWASSGRRLIPKVETA